MCIRDSIGTASATDPEGQNVTFSLSGTGSENFSVDSSGNISLVYPLDYETATSYTLALNASDGVNTTTSEFIVTVDDVNEAPSLTNSLAASSFAENVSTGTTIATASASDPESQTITYSLSGTGSGNFAVDSSGNITLAAGLDMKQQLHIALHLAHLMVSTQPPILLPLVLAMSMKRQVLPIHWLHLRSRRMFQLEPPLQQLLPQILSLKPSLIL